MEASRKDIKLVRHDLTNATGSEDGSISKDNLVDNSLEERTELLQNTEIWPNDREACIRQFGLPRDSIIKVYYEGHLIPWSLLQKCSNVEIKVYRPNQNVKPTNSNSDANGTEDSIREKVRRLETRISSLENVVNPDTIKLKTDRDLQILTKQISFLSRRLDEADQAEWVKKT